MNGEMVMGRTFVQQLGKNKLSDFIDNSDYVGAESPTEIKDLLVRNPRIRKALEAKAMEVYVWELERLPKDPNRWEETVAIQTQVERRIESDKSVFNTLNRSLIPGFSQAGTAIGATLTRRRLTASMIRLCKERNRTGTFPSALPSYGETSTDPFSGKPFRYRRTNTGFVLYSVGHDRVDNGGVPNPKSSLKDIIVEMR
jgi:hypothetical protein